MRDILTCFIVIVLCGCMREGTTRTDLSTWDVYELRAVGIQIERPVKARYGLNLHHHSSGSICDGVDRITISVEKYTPKAFDEVRKISPDNPLNKSQDYTDWLKWLGTFHDELSERPLDTNRKEYRRDVRTKEYIVTIHATYIFGEFSTEEREMDEAAIKRILLSAKPIE